MRTAKILAASVGGIAALLVAGLLAVWLWVNPNDYKAKIAAAVKESTGRDLVMTGAIKLSLFPWVALELGPAILKNPPGFGEEPFLSFNHATVRVRLLPLLVKHLDMERVEFAGLDVRLRKDAEGRGNWENFGPRREPAANSNAGAGADGNAGADVNASADGAVSAGAPSLAGIRVTDGRVSYPGVVIENVTLETGAIGGRDMTPINISFDANRGVRNEAVTATAKFALSAESHSGRLRFAAVNVVSLLSRPGLERPARWEMSAPAIDADLDGQTLAVPAFVLSYSNARLSGKLLATKILDGVEATGSVILAPLDLREFAPRRVALPKTRDPKVFALLSASSDFGYDASGLHLDQMQIQLDDTHVMGNAALAGEPRALKFDLTADQIDVGRYRREEGSAAADAPATAGAIGSTAGNSATSAATAKHWDTNGTLKIGLMQWAGINFSKVRVTLASKDNVLHLFPLQAQIDGGRYSGDITIDRRAAIPVLSLDEHFFGIDMARLLANSAHPGRLSGHANMDLKATARGAGLAPILQSLNGHVDAYVTEGAVEGVDVGYELARAQVLLNRQSTPPRENTHHTAFDAFKMSADVVNGVVKTSDLVISSQAVRVTGQGSANLPSKALDLQLHASIMKSPTSVVADVPLKITGTYVNPAVKADIDTLVKGQLKQKLEDVLKKNGLDGLFSK